MSKANKYTALMVGLGLAAFALTAFVPPEAQTALIIAGTGLCALAVPRRGEREP